MTMNYLQTAKKRKRIRHQLYVMRKALKKARRKRYTYRYKKTRSIHVDNLKHQTPVCKIQLLLEYHVFFGDDAESVDIKELVSVIPREMLFNFVGVLNNIYGDATLDKLNLFFSPKSVNNRHLVYNRIIQLNAEKPQHEYIFCSDVTCMEIMRYAFAYSPMDSDVKISEEKGEMLFFKLLLAINEKVVTYSILEEDKTVYKMHFLLSVINPIVKAYDRQEIIDRLTYQLELSMKFFVFLTTNEKYAHLYELFLLRHNIKCWEDYVLTILGIIIAGDFKAGHIDKDLKIDKEHILSKDVIDSISILSDTFINYTSSEKNNRKTNSDYRMFRSKPIIRLKNGDFFIYNIEFLLDSLFNSLYFEFKSFEQLGKQSIDINKLFTDSFSEKTIFCYYMNQCVNSSCVGISEAQSHLTYTKQDKELGPPDYILYDKSSIILFECKDIRINGDILETHDYGKIVQEYSKKLYKKPTKSGYERIGITQLTGHIKSIRDGTFHWLDIKPDIKIYPILVLSDYKNVRMGLNHITDEWYKTSINEMGLSNSLNGPLVVMSFITLFKYHSLFKQRGFAYYVDSYSKLIMRSSIGNNVLASNMSFDQYMSRYPYHLCDMKVAIHRIIQNKMEKNK